MQFNSELKLSNRCMNILDKKIVGDTKIFTRKVDLVIVCTSIGVFLDKSIKNESSDNFEDFSIGRNTLVNPELNNLFEFIFINAIINSNTINYTDEERLDIAFNDNNNLQFSINSFISGFANAGAEYIIENIDLDNDDNLELSYKLFEIIKTLKEEYEVKLIIKKELLKK